MHVAWRLHAAGFRADRCGLQQYFVAFGLVSSGLFRIPIVHETPGGFILSHFAAGG